MGLFFMISGYFVPGSVDRKGLGNFLIDRFLRLGVPLVAFYFFIGPATALGAAAASGDRIPWFDAYRASLGFGPLWFVEALLAFTCLYAVWRFLTRGRAVPRLPLHDGPPTYRAITGFTIALAAATFLWRVVVPVGMWVPNIDFPTLAYLPQYASLFILGAVASRRGWFTSIPDSMGRVGWAMAAAVTVILFPIALAGMPDAMGNGSWPSVFYALWDSTFCVGMALGLVTLFRKRFDTPWPLGKLLATNTYAVYVIHAPVIVAVAIALSGLDVHPLLKFALAVVVGVPLCFLCAQLVRRLPGASAVL
jgi:glucans biosynthesis protein C